LKQFAPDIVCHVVRAQTGQPRRQKTKSNHSIDTMKKKLTILIAGLAVAGVASFTLPSVFAQPTNTTPAVPHHHAERHPAIRHAISALEAAKNDMQHASHDFGGHRAAALAECDKAIEQLREALKYDKE
jgi:hypothetical protein